MHLIITKASSRTSCVDVMTRKSNDGHVGNSSTRATGYMYIRCLAKTRSKLFYQFLSQDFLKMVNDRTSSVHDVGSRLLSQSIAIVQFRVEESSHIILEESREGKGYITACKLLKLSLRCLAKTRSKLFYQFLSQDFLKMVNDRTSSGHDVGSRLLSQSIAIDDWFLCTYRLIID